MLTTTRRRWSGLMIWSQGQLDGILQYAVRAVRRGTPRDVRFGAQKMTATASVRDTLPANVTIRHDLRTGDISRLIALHAILHAEARGWDATFEAYVAGPLAEFALSESERERIWIADEGGKLTGCVAIVEASEEEAQLRWLMLVPHLRGRGLGRMLVEEAVGFCREAGYASVFLWTVAGLDAALHIYESVGFDLKEEETHPIWGAVLTEQRYDLKLR